eukprot:scaffold4740_cov165-Amphora_coffeaeformis.AAC.17
MTSLRPTVSLTSGGPPVAAAPSDPHEIPLPESRQCSKGPKEVKVEGSLLNPADSRVDRSWDRNFRDGWRYTVPRYFSIRQNVVVLIVAHAVAFVWLVTLVWYGRQNLT